MSTTDTDTLMARAWAEHDKLEQRWLDACTALRNEPDEAKRLQLGLRADFAAAHVNGAQAILKALVDPS